MEGEREFFGCKRQDRWLKREEFSNLDVHPARSGVYKIKY